jgi:DNA-binding GntR family transcriptional regulator
VIEGLLPTFEPRTVAQQVYSSLQRAILTGLLAPGERLTESFLASQFSTSRAPLREALLRLENEGLVISSPHRGTFVVELSETDVDEIYSIASLIEAFAGRLAAQRGAGADLQSLQDIVDAMRATSAVADPKQEVAELDYKFHLRLVELSGNTRLLRLWLSLSSQFRLSMTASMEDYTRPGHLAEDMAASHQEVVDALREDDPDAAERLIRMRSGAIRRKVKAAPGRGSNLSEDQAAKPTLPENRASHWSRDGARHLDKTHL